MANSNNGLADIFADLMSGAKTIEQVKQELDNSKFYLRAGRNYKELKFDGIGRVNGEAVNVYVPGKKIDSNGNAVTSKPRASKGTKKRGS
jgi:hypothetical protein